jgi:hypothetical protein
MRGVSRAWCGLAALLLVAACAHDVRARPEIAEQATVDEDLYAAAVRGTLKHFGVADKAQLLYCVVLPDGVPSDRFLARFTNDPFLIAGPKSCRWNGGAAVLASRTYEVVSNEQRTGAHVTPIGAVFLEVNSIRFKSPDRAEADTALIHGYLHAYGLTLKLERKDGQWKVVEAEETWIS